MDNIGILDAAVIASLGYGVVFFGIVLLLLVVVLVSKAFTAKKQPKAEKAAPAPSSAPAAQPASPVAEPVAPGSAGQLKLHDVEPKVAAMLMAIVANKMGKPLNELRFISIKEVK